MENYSTCFLTKLEKSDRIIYLCWFRSEKSKHTEDILSVVVLQENSSRKIIATGTKTMKQY